MNSSHSERQVERWLTTRVPVARWLLVVAMVYVVLGTIWIVTL